MEHEVVAGEAVEDDLVVRFVKLDDREEQVEAIRREAGSRTGDLVGLTGGVEPGLFSAGRRAGSGPAAGVLIR
jgi:hypothetical protein